MRKKYGNKKQINKKNKNDKKKDVKEEDYVHSKSKGSNPIQTPSKYEKLNSKTTEVLDFSSTSTNTSGKKNSKSNKSNGPVIITIIDSGSDKSKLIEAFRTLTQQLLKDMITESKGIPAVFCEKFSKLFPTFQYVPNIEKPAEPLKFLTSNQQVIRKWGDNLSFDEATSCLQILLNFLLNSQGQFNSNANVSQLVLLQILAQQQPRSYLNAVSTIISVKFSKDLNTRSIKNLIWLISQLDQEPSLAIQLFLQAFVKNPDFQSSEFKSNSSSDFNSNDFASSISKDKNASKDDKKVVLSKQSKIDILQLLDDIVGDLKNQSSPEIHNIHQKLYVGLLKFRYTHFLSNDSDSLKELISFITKQLLAMVSTNFSQYFILLWNLLNMTVNSSQISIVDKENIKKDLLEKIGLFFEADSKSCVNQWESIDNKSSTHKISSKLIFNFLSTRKPPLNRSAKNDLSKIKNKINREESITSPNDKSGGSYFVSIILGFIGVIFLSMFFGLVSLTLICKEMNGTTQAETLLSIVVSFIYNILKNRGITAFIKETGVCKRLSF